MIPVEPVIAQIDIVVAYLDEIKGFVAYYKDLTDNEMITIIGCVANAKKAVKELHYELEGRGRSISMGE